MRRLLMPLLAAIVLLVPAATGADAVGQGTLLPAGMQLAPELKVWTSQVTYAPYQTITVDDSGVPAGTLMEIWIDPASVAPSTTPGADMEFLQPGPSMTLPGMTAPGEYVVRLLDVPADVLLYEYTFAVASPGQTTGQGTATTGGGTAAGTTGGHPAAGNSALLPAGQELTPALVIGTDKRTYTPFQTIRVGWSGFPAGSEGELWIAPSAVAQHADRPPANDQFMDGAQGSDAFADLRLAPGSYTVWALDLTASPAAFVARATFRVVGAKGLKPGTSTTGGMYGERVWTQHTSYRPEEPVVVDWSGLPPDHTIEFWFAKAGAALTIGPQGPYHSDGATSGSFQLPSPGPGEVWQVQWIDLSVSPAVPQRGNAFTVGGGHAKLAQGHYGCYFYFGAMGLSRSSIQYIEVVSPSRYRTPAGAGNLTYTPSTQTVRLTSGPLRGRVAHFIPTSGFTGQAAVAFLRAQNAGPGGRPTIDVGDTYCYIGKP